jgi:hypothetical protein
MALDLKASKKVVTLLFRYSSKSSQTIFESSIQSQQRMVEELSEAI